jgi:hypothetical protein
VTGVSVVTDDFDQRCHEVRRFIDHLLNLEEEGGVDIGLMATMKASAMLMIYNVMESSMANAIEAIFDHLRSERIGFIDVDDNIKQMVLTCAKRRNSKDLVARMRDEVIDLVIAAFQKDEIFSGNVDARMIRSIWDDYGISRTGSYEEPVLLEVKTARNDLAHGSKSFSELGRSLTARDIGEKFDAAKEMLSKAIADVETHIATRLRRRVA